MFKKNSIFIKSLFLVLMLFGNLSHAHITIIFETTVLTEKGRLVDISDPNFADCNAEAKSRAAIGYVPPECKAHTHLYELILPNPPSYPIFPRPDGCTTCPTFLLDLSHNIKDIKEQWEQVVNPAQLDRLKELHDRYNINSYNKEKFYLQQQYNLEGYAKEFHDLQLKYR